MSSAASLSSALASVPVAPSFSVQPDWQVVLREWTAAARGPTGSAAAAERLPKESRQFWASAARFGDDGSQREAIAHLEDGAAEMAAAAAAAGSAVQPATSSLSAAARSVRLNTSGPNSDADVQLQFRTPLQLLMHSDSLRISQLVLAPRATHAHLHPKGDVTSVDVNAQGTMGVSAGGATVRVWDATSGLLKSDLTGHVGDVHLTRWFPSGSVALSAGLDLALKVWAVEPQAAMATQLTGHTRPITQVCFIGRGRNLVTSSEDGTAKLWDVSRQSAVATYPAHKEDCPPQLRDALLLDPTAHPIKMNEGAGGVEVSDASGHLLLTGGSDGIVRGFDLRSQGQVLMLPSGGRAGGIESLCAGPVAHSFTLGTAEGAIAVIDMRNKQPMYTMRQDDAAITRIRPWSDDAFWTADSTGAVNLWRLSGSSGSIVAQLSGVDCEPAHDLCLTSNAAFVASYDAVRCYTIGTLPTGADTQEWFGLALPARRMPPASGSASA